MMPSKNDRFEEGNLAPIVTAREIIRGFLNALISITTPTFLLTEKQKMNYEKIYHTNITNTKGYRIGESLAYGSTASAATLLALRAIYH